jgi:hypothetical protein
MNPTEHSRACMLAALLGVAMALPVAGCGTRPDLDADRAALLELHELARTAHLEKRADLMVASFADSLANIARGAVTMRTPAESRERLQAYFDRSTFAEWDDLAPPVIRIAPDGQMAYVIVQKSVRLSAPDSLGVPRPEHTIFAWLEVYEKQGGKWTLTVVASTDRPGKA